MAKKKDDGILEIPVTFAGLSVGDKTCRLGMSASRENLKLAVADKNLCDKRLTVRLLARSNKAAADQASIPGLDNDTTIDAVIDVKGFRVSAKEISFGGTFMLESVDVETLAHFPRRDGRLSISGTDTIPDDERQPDDDPE